MTTLSQNFEQAQLSLAAYALNLQRGMFEYDDTNYLNSLERAGMSRFQAAEFAKTYSVLDQYTDPATGFSATVF